MNIKKAGILILFITTALFSGNAAYEIRDLSGSDEVFEKFKSDIHENWQKWRGLKKNFKINRLQDLKRLSIAIYEVQKEDTVFSIAEKLGMVSDTLISFNSLASNLSLKEKEEVLVPNIKEIADIYNIPSSMLMYINNIQRNFVYPREEIFIPFARMSDEEKNYFLAKPFIYPLKKGRFSSNYGMRVHPISRKWKFHGGLDIATPIGSKVYAAAEGTVKYAGWGKGYGRLVVLKHKYGYTSWYGHLSKALVKKGQKVSQGDLIAISGNTGRSTGPHLHFEIRRFNHRKNPMEVLDFQHDGAE
jgi:murein DD-endopeptidase MepM/ murein hydrolase activator NlpD